MSLMADDALTTPGIRIADQGVDVASLSSSIQTHCVWVGGARAICAGWLLPYGAGAAPAFSPVRNTPPSRFAHFPLRRNEGDLDPEPSKDGLGDGSGSYWMPRGMSASVPTS